MRMMARLAKHTGLAARDLYQWAWARRYDAIETSGLGLGAWTLWEYWTPLAGGLAGAIALVYLANGWARR